MSFFGSINRFISRLDADGEQQQKPGVGGAYGFQVLRNKNTDIAIEPWFDHIIGINGRTLVGSEKFLGRYMAYACPGHSRSKLVRNRNPQLRWQYNKPRSMECEGASHCLKA